MNTSLSESDEVAVLFRRLLDAWNRRSAEDFAALFADDGSTVGFDGSQVNGRSEIAAHLATIFTDHQTPVYVGKVREVRLIAPGVAILCAVSGPVPPGQSDINPALNSVQTLVATRRDGRWQGRDVPQHPRSLPWSP